MQGKPASIILLFLLVVSALVLAHNVQPVKSNYTWTQTIYIRADGSIQPPTAPISSFDNVTYTLTDNIAGNVTAGSSAITIQRDNIIVNGAGHTLQGITASISEGINMTGRNNVTIKNMKITALYYGIYLSFSSNNNIVSGNNITNSESGIELYAPGNNNIVSGNNITNSGSGIELYSSGYNIVSGNNITANNWYGVYIGSYCSNNRVSGNNITSINYMGVYIGSYCSNNIVSGNSITNSTSNGIYLFSSSNNSISGNNVTNNGCGIYLWHSSDYNSIFHNNFVNNNVQVSSDSVNVWDDGYPSGGNFWSDYNGTDEKSGPTQTQPGYDGIGDAPYIIAANNTDRYPLMQPLTGEGVLTVQTPAGSNVTVSPMVNVNITFANVTVGGFTSWNTVQPPTDQFVSVICNEIRTSANYTGNVTLKFAYDPLGLSLQDQQAMKIWLWTQSSSCWVDITASINTTSHVVYGLSPHLSMFGVTSNLGITGDLAVQGTTNVSIPIAPPAPPHSLAALNYYQINTTKSLSAPISLSLAYNYVNIPPEEEIFTQMWMWNEASGFWVDITTGVNATSHMVYGSAPHLSMFGVTSLPQPPDGIAVASANCPKTVVCQGYSVNINVTIRNQGDFPQTNFNVLLFWNTTLRATYHIDQLESQGQITLNFTLITVGWAKGNYSISAFSHGIGWIVVSRIGDLTGGSANPWSFVPDGVVDGSDLSIVAKCFGSWPAAKPPLTWNANCDVNNDGVVDGSDLAIVAKRFGEGGP